MDSTIVVERVVGVTELCVGELGDAGLELVGDAAVAKHHAEHAGGAGGIAVGVLAAAGGDLHRLQEVALAEEQAEGDVGAVELGVDVERR